MADLVRREVVRALAVGGAMGLTGCDIFGKRRAPESKIAPAEFPDPSRIQPILRPTITATPANPFPTLDAHAHFFNASDVNVKDYIGECFGHDMKTELGHEFFRTLAKAADMLARFAPTARAEFDKLLAMLDSDQAKSNGMDGLPGEDYETMSQRIYDAARNSGFLDEYNRQQRAYLLKTSEQHGAASILQEAPALTREVIRDLIDPARRQAQDKAAFFQGQPGGSDAPAGFVTFLGHMLSHRYSNLRTYARYYSVVPGSFGITGVFGSLVDFDHWLDNAIYSSRRDQMLLHSLLSAMSGGYMLPLISFNPWQSPASASESFALMKDAILNWGYVGVKVYPPIGYYPYGNTKLLTNPGRYTGDLAKLDATLKEMYDWCARHDVPVMAHANQTKGIIEAADNYGGPDGYDRLLDAYNTGTQPGKLAPTILAGHFGGSHNKGAAWPDAFIRFLDKPNGVGRNFYSDIAFWDEFLDCRKPNAKCEGARQRIRTAVAVSAKAPSHLVYGSDWFMMSSARGWDRYPAAVQAALCPAPLDARALFHDNVRACFGLGPGSQQTERVVKRLKPTPGGVPAWLLGATG